MKKKAEAGSKKAKIPEDLGPSKNLSEVREVRGQFVFYHDATGRLRSHFNLVYDLVKDIVTKNKDGKYIHELTNLLIPGSPLYLDENKKLKLAFAIVAAGLEELAREARKKDDAKVIFRKWVEKV
mgnify:CR=1 FL=1